jgi:hypothetical protein
VWAQSSWPLCSHNVASLDIDVDRIYMPYDNAVMVLKRSEDTESDEYKPFAKEGKARKLVVDDRAQSTPCFTSHSWIVSAVERYPWSIMTLCRDFSATM